MDAILDVIENVKRKNSRYYNIDYFFFFMYNIKNIKGDFGKISGKFI